MESRQIQTLRTHAEHLAMALIQEADQEGIIRTQGVDGSIGPDIPATHHLVEVLRCLDANMFSDGVAAAVGWLRDPKNGVAEHPFALDSYLPSAPVSESTETILRRGIASLQLRDGAIPVFCAYLPGGDYFSTLWSVKILSRYPSNVFAGEINRALGYLKERRDVGRTSISQLGFFGLLIAQIQPDQQALLSEISSQVLPKLALPPGHEESPSLLERLFLLEDLLAMDGVIGGLLPEIDAHLSALFSLSEDAAGPPAALEQVRTNYSESMFLETVARSAIVATLRVRRENPNDMALAVNRLVHSHYRETRYKALQSTAALRSFLDRYGGIHRAFSRYNSKLEAAWRQTAFDRCVFLMMPFKKTLNYRRLTEVIRNTAKLHGYRTVRVDDADRRFEPLLWDNLMVNMLSCKYAIAVYVSEPVVDRLTKDEVRLFSNPNVALEFGFFTSRAQEVLLLKDEKSELPSDLRGFLWSDFDIENPDETLPRKLDAWFATLTQKGAPIEATES